MLRLPRIAPHAAAIGLALAAVLNFAAPVGASSGGDCQFILGFKALHDLAGSDVGTCLANQSFVANGDAQQPTTNGLLVWRKADNFTAFTDGYHTWVAGPFGVQERLNSERFPWEAADDASSVAGATLQGGPFSPAASAQQTSLLGGLASQFYADLNQDRTSHGLNSLALNSQLSSLAQTRAQGLVPKGGALSHYDTNGQLILKEIMDDNHIPYVTAGENLAENNFAVADTVQVANTALMNSPTHRANILGPNYTQVGIGMAGPDGAGRYYYVQLFLQAS